MSIAAVVGARLYTSTVALEDIGATQAEIADMETEIEVGLIANIGDIGRRFETVTFPELATGRTFKLKGSFNDGMLRVHVGQDLTDSGQSALRSYARSGSSYTYPFRLIFEHGSSIVSDDSGVTAVGDTDGTLVGGPGDSILFGAVVMSFRTVVDDAGTVVRATSLLDVNTQAFLYTA